MTSIKMMMMMMMSTRQSKAERKKTEGSVPEHLEIHLRYSDILS